MEVISPVIQLIQGIIQVKVNQVVFSWAAMEVMVIVAVLVVVAILAEVVEPGLMLAAAQEAEAEDQATLL